MSATTCSAAPTIARAQQVRRRDPEGRPRRRRPGLSGDHPPVAVEAAGLRGQERRDPATAGSLAAAAGRRRGRHLPLLATPVLGAGVRGQRPELRRLGQEADRRADHHRRTRWACRASSSPPSAARASQPASIDGLLERLERDEFDLVGVGRAILQDPEWVVKIRDGRNDELKSFERDALGVLY